MLQDKVEAFAAQAHLRIDQAGGDPRAYPGRNPLAGEQGIEIIDRGKVLEPGGGIGAVRLALEIGLQRYRRAGLLLGGMLARNLAFIVAVTQQFLGQIGEFGDRGEAQRQAVRYRSVEA